MEEVEGVPPQITATPGMPERKAVARRQARVRANLHLLPKSAQEAILDSLEGTHKYPTHELPDEVGTGRHRGDETSTATMPTQRQ
ncbi:sulfate/thiosulfate ABC superfamily ATP binding cassette transporter, ABC domain protein [Mycobacterium xenopi 3993]|nr:sulfate/thiosulfate ABC superfamily ATP binding cassette transporter, ABC domain protein [Mycobacterium xenopi 3993]